MGRMSSSFGIMAGLLEHAAWISTLFLTLVLSLLLLRISKVGKTKKTRQLPSPPKLPIIGNLHQLGELPHHSLRDLSLKHGPLMLLKLGPIPTLVVSSADLAQEFMKTHDLNFASRPVLVSAMKLFYGCKDVAFSPYGEYWRQAKKICVLELLSTKRVQSFSYVREEEVANMIRTISGSKGSVVNMSKMLDSLSNDIVCRIVLGKKYVGGDGKKSFAELSKENGAILASFRMGDFFPSMGWMDVLTGLAWREKKCFQAWDDLLECVIQEHVDGNRDGKQHRDFVDVLLHVQEHSSLDTPLTKQDIKALIMDMTAAGTDTTSTTLVWTMAEIIKNPKVLKKVIAEICEVVGEKVKVEESDIYRMHYLKSTIKESLRLHPAAPLLLPHESIRDTEIQGYVIPAKTRVYINAWAIGLDPKSWESAEEFLPDRFINSSIDFKSQDFSFIPFGAGRRGCPGISFASSIMELVLANLLHQFDWDLPNAKNVKDLDMAEASGTVIRKKSDLLLIATPRFI